MRWKLGSKSLPCLLYNMVEAGKGTEGDTPNRTPTQLLCGAQHSPIRERKISTNIHPPSPSHQVRSHAPSPTSRMLTGRLWLQLLFSKSLGFPLHETKLID